MKTKIQAQQARNITGRGIILQFNVIEGEVKSGMKFESGGVTFEIGDMMFSFIDEASADESLRLQSPSKPNAFKPIQKATPSEKIVQANLNSAPGSNVQTLLANEKGIFDLE